MDPKGDDSGSDSLDQSLLKKCVVADDDSSPKQPDAAESEDYAAEEFTTEPGGNVSDPKDSPASPSPPPSLLSTDNNSSDAHSGVLDKDLPDENSNSSGKDDSRGFESKVRQISDELKETTLADENSLEKVDDRNVIKEEVDDSDAAPEVALDDNKNDSDGYDSDRTITYESPSKKSSSCSSEKKKSKEITKVRFKFYRGKVCSDDEEGEEDDDESEIDGDDEDEEGDYEDEEEVDEEEVDEEEDDDDADTLNQSGISKKMRIPMSFASVNDNEEELLSGHATAELLEQAAAQEPQPEGGVQNVLGKVSQMGKVEYLFRWVNKPGLQWEEAGVLKKLCPNLIKLYEKKRSRDRSQDMHYVIRHKKIRKEMIDV